MSLLISHKKKKIINRIPCHILFSWLLTIPTHVFLLSNQSSHLNTWPKPNGLADLLASYNDSIFFISIVIPIASFLMIKSYMDKKQPFPKDTTTKNATVITTSILWLVAPTLFWILSHISELNLFVDRYFIPKEVAVIVLSAWIVNILLTTIPKISSANTVKYTTTCFCSALILVSTKRASFGLRKETNYHHSLIIEDPLPVENQPIVLRGDPSYFPNAYLGKNDYIFYLQNNSLNKTYKSFSKKIKINFECRKN
jgi:hypothetical protein